MGEFVCSQCETFARFADKHSEFHTECPVCEEVTLWEIAFDGDAVGVEF